MADRARRDGIRIGRVLGVPIFITPSWFLFALFIVVTYGAALQGQVGRLQGYLAGAAFALLLGASVLLHEIGHCAVARVFRLPVRGITISLIAGVTEITEPPQTPGREYCVAVAGPMVSLFLCLFGLAAIPLFDHGGLARLVVEGVAVTNGVVAGFNLLPGLPLDGGRVLRAAVWHLSGDAGKATIVSAWAGRLIGLAVVPMVLLVLLPAAGVGSQSIPSIVFAALLGSFIYAGATASLRRAEVGQKLPGVTVRGLTRPALSVRSDLPVSEAVRQVQQAGVRGLVIVDGANMPEAVVSEAAVIAVPEARRPWVSIGTLSRRLTAEMVLDADLVGEDLLVAMRRAPSAEYVVRDRATGALGVLSAVDVAAAVSR